jgi:hypothetical protein
MSLENKVVGVFALALMLFWMGGVATGLMVAQVLS